MPKKPVTFDIVIATRNRANALELSIPLMLCSPLKPQKLVVIDSSDDHDAVVRAVQKSVSGYNGEVIIEYSATPGTSLQRNIGMAYSKADVIIFPDDDSLFFNNTVEVMLRVYQLDTEKQVSAVCSAEAETPPPEANLETAYAQSKTDTWKKAISALRFKLERKYFPDPFLRHGQLAAQKLIAPDWLEEENCILAEYMTGFRMSFRGEVIKKVRFNETFKRYGLFEDTDASFGALESGLIIGARNTQIYHHKFPGKRDNGLTLGFLQILNRAYIIAKHSANEPKTVKQLYMFSRYKVFQYAIAATGQFQRDRLKGAIAAYKSMSRLLNCSAENLDKTYSHIIDELIKK